MPGSTEEENNGHIDPRIFQPRRSPKGKLKNLAKFLRNVYASARDLDMKLLVSQTNSNRLDGREPFVLVRKDYSCILDKVSRSPFNSGEGKERNWTSEGKGDAS